MKVIFLDIDGVLNVIPKGHDEYGAIFHPEFVENLRTIIHATDAKIVITSVWRFSGLQKMRNMWVDRKLPGQFYGITPFTADLTDPNLPFDARKERGNEIKQWLGIHPEVENYKTIKESNSHIAIH
jgi:hypothetical protein